MLEQMLFQIFYFLMFIYLEREREFESMSRGGSEREGGREFQAGCMYSLSAEPHTGLDLTN